MQACDKLLHVTSKICIFALKSAYSTLQFEYASRQLGLNVCFFGKAL